MNYELSLEHYQGPLPKLLELIETKKLEITLVSLAQVTADFLKYLETQVKQEQDKDTALGESAANVLADFLLIASKLLLIKSKVLLPTLTLSEEEASDIQNLELRLKLYQELKNAERHLKDKWQALPQMIGREFFASRAPIFYPPPSITQKQLLELLIKIIGELETIWRPQVALKHEFINLKNKIEEVVARLHDTPASLEQLHAQRSKGELIILFLAILHLLKEQLIEVKQKGAFGEIFIAKRKKIK